MKDKYKLIIILFRIDGKYRKEKCRKKRRRNPERENVED